MTVITQTKIPDHIRPDQVFDFDIYADPRIDDDVQGTYSVALRDAPDIFWTPRNGGHWMVKSYDRITDIVKNPDVFSAREMQIPRVEKPPFLIPLSLDPPENLPYRHILMPQFSPRSVKALEPRLRELAAECVEAVVDQGHCDFVHDVAARFPVSAFMTLMGLPLEKLHEFRAIADEHFKALTDAEFAVTMGKIHGIFIDLMEQRRAAPADDLISYFMQAEIEGRRLRDAEILAMCLVLFLGGMDTVTNVTSFTFQHLAQDPELQARLAAYPDLLPKFAEEGLRMFGVIGTPRLVVKDYDAFGVSFREGEMVVNALWMSGRDATKLPDANAFDIDRDEQPHLNFGTGPHLCLGHALARAEMRILGEEWLKRIPSFRAKAGVKHGFRIGTVIALGSLPLEWDL